MVYRQIYAPSVDTLYSNSAVFRLYGGNLTEYSGMSTPPNNVSLYGLIWTLPGRKAATFQYAPGPTGKALSETDSLFRRGMLAAHTLVIKPKHPEIYADPWDLLPPHLRPKKKVWYTDDGTQAGWAPGVHPEWVEREAPNWIPGTHPAGTIVWYNGHAWRATGEVSGIPGEDPLWQKILAWDPHIAYPPDSYVVTSPGAGGVGTPPPLGDGTFIGRPPGGDMPQVFMRGITFDGTYVWMVDDGPKALLRGIPAVVGSGNALVSWSDYMFFRADGTTALSWSLADYSSAVQLRDITWDGQHLWIVRQDNQTVMKVRTSDRTIVSTLSLTDFTPLAVAFDGTNLWVHSVARSEIVVMERDGVVQFLRPHYWTDDNLSGMGWDPAGGSPPPPENIQQVARKALTHFERNYIQIRKLLAGGQ